MKPKKHPEYETSEISATYLEYAVSVYNEHSSIRAAARELNISPMKMRKLLITYGEYDNEMSKEIQMLHASGMSIEEIAKKEAMTISNVYAYLPYENVIYNLSSKSVTAERQERYRNRMGEKAIVDDKLIAWLECHPGIVADLKRRAGLEQSLKHN